MTSFGHSGRRRFITVGLLTLPLAVGGLVFSGVAQGASTPGPSMEVLPTTTGLKYSQTVEIKGHHLPKGSGSVAATICGLADSAGKTIASPTADDCAGASEIGKLVIVKSWQSDGEFDTQYTLPTSGQKFGTNNRFCDAKHRCALVVADANPNAPAYHKSKEIQFVDQASTTTTTKPKTTTTKKSGTTPTTKPTTTTTKPKTTPTTAPPKTTTTVATGTTGSGSGSGSVKVGVTVEVPTGAGTTPTLPPVTLPTAPANPIPAPAVQALNTACTQLASAVKSAGGDPSALLTACAAIAGGNGPQQLAVVLQSPSLLCIEGASAWQNNQQITDACNQAASALAPVTSPIASTLSPILNGL